AGIRDRLRAIVKRLPVDGNHDAWSALLYAVAGHLIGASSIPSIAVDEMSAAELALAKWIAVTLEGQLSLPATENRDVLDRLFLEKCAVGELDITDIGPA